MAPVARLGPHPAAESPLATPPGTHAEFHYSCVFYLASQARAPPPLPPAPPERPPALPLSSPCAPAISPELEILASQGEDFEGGTLHFSDAPGEEGGGGERVLTPLSPQRGAAIIFSSGWENMHVVEPLVSGERIAVPSFFTTQKPEGVTGPPDDPDALWQAFLTPDSAGDVRSFMFHWHELMAPGR